MVFHDAEKVMANPDSGVQSVSRALTLLELLGQEEEGLRLSDLARAAGLALSTTHRLLTTLELRGFAHFDGQGARWHVGRQAFATGSAYLRRRHFTSPALPVLRRLRDQTRETANLGILDGAEVVTLHQAESREIVRAISPVGGRAPWHASGMGKAIVAVWPDDQIGAMAARHGLRPLTPRSLTTPDGLWAEIAVIRHRGYAVDDEEFVPGLRCVAAVVWSPSGEPACAISVSAHAGRLTRQRVAAVGSIVVAAADALTRSLGGRRPDQALP
ncbi:IclR family transcriptional regulator [Halodurantibacterium flavum]|uniref:IclR family transcriptional regulator n=1 Tax=Halodurantibacterium flavum TaxID=1382802 RepID=A0ABW4S8D6_9RHOB